MISVFAVYYDLRDSKILSMWSTSYRMFEVRSKFMKDCKDVEEILMEEEKFYEFERDNSDSRLSMYEIRAGISDEGEEVTISMPLTYSEYGDIAEWFEQHLMENVGIYIPPDIFNSKYNKALRSFGMDILYAMFSYKVNDFNNSEFASTNGLLYDEDDAGYCFWDVILANELCILVKNYMTEIKNKKKKRKKSDKDGK